MSTTAEPTPRKSITDSDIVAERFEHRLSQPYVPQQIPAPNMSEAALLRIANAVEYSAGQLFHIRKLLEQKGGVIDGGTF